MVGLDWIGLVGLGVEIVAFVTGECSKGTAGNFSESHLAASCRRVCLCCRLRTVVRPRVSVQSVEDRHDLFNTPSVFLTTPSWHHVVEHVTLRACVDGEDASKNRAVLLILLILLEIVLKQRSESPQCPPF